MEEIKITLETLYDILRNEKKKEDLQQLNESFFFDVVNYLKEKKSLLESKKDEDDLFAAGEREKLEYELRSIKRILKETYEKREKKIINIALNRSRTKSDIVDTSALLKEEKDFYEQLISLLDGYRNGILMSLFKCEVPFFKKPSLSLKKPETPPEEETNIQETDLSGQSENNPTKTSLTPTKEDGQEKETLDKTGNKEPNNPEPPPFKKIKFIHPVPSFVWKDLKEYGPWEAGEETRIFPEVADLMIEKGRAEEAE